MRAHAIIAAASILGAVPAFADELPQRKAGLWETKSTGAEGETTAKQCVGPGTDRAMLGGMTGGACAKVEVKKTATGYAVATECTIGQINAVGSSVVTGDFQTIVRTEGSTKLTGMPGQPGPVERKLVVEAKRVGDCGPGQKPGDIILPDGKVISMPGAAPKP
ncbi:hypothetical protein OIU35_08655 [Boseaceae bacterium BT-24-1]|nr:hypothetical protein [Boseaceae bacterium BT-24-1]